MNYLYLVTNAIFLTLIFSISIPNKLIAASNKLINDSTSNKQENNQTISFVVKYNIVKRLKGNYLILKRTFNNPGKQGVAQLYYTNKNGKVLCLLLSQTKNGPGKYYFNDFSNFFLFELYYGSNPPCVFFIDKEKGNENKLGYLVGINKNHTFIIYSKEDVPNFDDSLIVYSVKSNQSFKIPYPPKVFKNPAVLKNIWLKSSDKTGFVLGYFIPKGHKFEEKQGDAMIETFTKNNQPK